MHAHSLYRIGAAAVATLLADRNKADCLFCANDELALGALFECRRRGIAVPGQLAIAGFNDLDIAAEVVPSLTTIRWPRYRIGAEAARLILERLEGTAADGRRIDLGFAIISRESA